MASVEQSYSLCLDILPLKMTLISIILINIIRSQSNDFNADTTYQWENQVINCTDNDTPCTITCDEYESCRDSTINCPKHSQCDISCTDYRSCREITINPPQNKSLSICSI